MPDTQPQWYRWEGDDLLLNARVQPRSSRDGLAGIQGGRLKVRITAPPVEGKANAHLVRFLAGLFGVPKSRVHLVRGAGGRDKQMRIEAPRALPPGIHPPGRL